MLLMAGASARLPLDDAYAGFYDLLGAASAAALARVDAVEAERKRAEMLAAIDRAKTVFFSNVSHEFRTPLTLMLGPLEEALRATSLAPARRARLDIASRNALRLLRLVNSLLDFSRIEAGRIEAELRADRPGAPDARPGQQLPLGLRARRPGLDGRLPGRCPSRAASTRRCGKRSS